MSDHQMQARKIPEITSDDLYDAYLASRMRKFGIGYQTAIMTPHIRTALIRAAQAAKRKKQTLQAQPA